MSKAKPYVSTAASFQEAMSVIAKLPGILSTAIGDWGKVDITIKKHVERRSIDQNRLQRKWCGELAQQGDMSTEEYRALCKLRFGVPILRRDNDEFCEKYDRLIKGRPYEEKIELMMEPMDFPITRLMDKSQKAEYLDAIFRHFVMQGFRLTDPNLRGMDKYPEAA